MSQTTFATSVGSLDRCLDAIADETRRHCLGTLKRCSTPLPVEVLATMVAAGVNDESPIAVTSDEHRRVHVDLVHVHLPKLADAGMIEWNRAEGTVAPADHGLFRDPDLQGLVETDADGWDAVLGAIEDHRCRLALAVLATADEPLDRRALVRRVLERERDVQSGTVPEDDVASAAVRFHHVAVPKLADAGLVDVDDDDRVRYVGHHALDVEWFLEDRQRQAEGGASAAEPAG